MKLLCSILLLSVMLFLSSCGGDSFSEEIVGTWNLQYFEITSCDDSTENVARTNVDADNCIPDIGICNVSVTINANGTGSTSEEDGGETDVDMFTYTADDDAEEGMVCDGDDCRAFTVDGDLITLTDTDSEDGCVFVAVYKKS